MYFLDKDSIFVLHFKYKAYLDYHKQPLLTF